MQVTLSLHERFLLETWLPAESRPGDLQTDARSLVATEQTLEPTRVHERLRKVQECLRDLQTQRSTLEVRPPMGRGFTSRQPGGTVLTWISPWEEAWLIVDRMRCADRLLSVAAAKELEDALSTSLVNAIAVAIICLDAATEGQQLARTIASDPSCAPCDRAWLLWLAGDGSVELADNLTEDLAGETPRKALVAALRGAWKQAEAALPRTLRKPFPKPIRPSGTRMHGQFLAQLASHALRGEPTAGVLDESLAVLFGFFGYDRESPWWDGREIATRLPLLALHARAVGAAAPGALLLHAQRRWNAHLTEPPPRTFVGPVEVVAAVAKLESVLAAAASGERGLEVSLTEEGNVYRVA